MMTPERGQQLGSLLAKLRKAWDSAYLNSQNLIVWQYYPDFISKTFTQQPPKSLWSLNSLSAIPFLH